MFFRLVTVAQLQQLDSNLGNMDLVTLITSHTRDLADWNKNLVL